MIFIIAEMVDECCDELNYSKHYYKKARMLNSEHMDVARKYLNLAKAELEHAYILHALAESLYESMSEECKNKIRTMYEDKYEEFVECYDTMSYLINKTM